MQNVKKPNKEPQSTSESICKRVSVQQQSNMAAKKNFA